MGILEEALARNPYREGSAQAISWERAKTDEVTRTIARKGEVAGTAAIAESIRTAAMTNVEVEAYEAAHPDIYEPAMKIVGGVRQYDVSKLPAGTVIHEAEEPGGLPGGVGALGMLTTGMLGGAMMPNENGTQLVAGADPGTALATTGVKAVATTGITAALAALGLPVAAAGILGGLGGFALSQLVGGGGAGAAGVVGGVTVGGPGVPEPPAAMVAKQWVILTHANDIGNYYIYFFKLLDGRIMCYNPRGKEWKIWRPKKMIVLSPDPRMSMIRKLDHVYNRTMRTLAKKTKALKLAH